MFFSQYLEPTSVAYHPNILIRSHISWLETSTQKQNMINLEFLIKIIHLTTIYTLIFLSLFILCIKFILMTHIHVTLHIDAHIGSLNDIAFVIHNEQLKFITCG